MTFLGCQPVDRERVDAEDPLDEPSGAEEALDEGAVESLKDSVSPSVIPANEPHALLVAPVATWMYLPQHVCLNAYPPLAPVDWKLHGYEEPGWQSGRSELGYGDGDEHKVIPFGPDANHKCITQFFRHTFQVADKDLYSSLVVQLLSDDGAAVYLNGTLIVRDNLPTSFNARTRASSERGGSEEDRFREFVNRPSPPNPANTVIPASLLVEAPAWNVLAVEVHQRSATNPDLSLNLSLLGRLNPVTLPGLTTETFSSFEATIDEEEPDAALGDDNRCEIDGASGDDNDEGETVCLAKWDTASIPDAAVVYAAHLVVDVENASTDRYEVYDLTRNWVEDAVTWEDADGGGPSDWTVPASFSPADFTSMPLTVVNSNGLGQHIYTLPASLVNTWAGSSDQAGIAFVDPISAAPLLTNENGLDFDADGDIRLVVTYDPTP